MRVALGSLRKFTKPIRRIGRWDAARRRGASRKFCALRRCWGFRYQFVLSNTEKMETFMFRHFRIAPMILFLGFARGCVVYDIRNQLREANQKLDRIDADFQQVSQTLKTSDQSLASINKSMEPIQISL